MKTKEQILEWLDKQPWANEFHKAVFTLREDLDLAYDKYFLSFAFRWERTEQGRDVWQKRNEEFCKWFDSNDKPLSWKEYCEQNPIKTKEYFISNSCFISSIKPRERVPFFDANVMSKDLCEAFLAYMKLIQLRNAWVEDCEPCRDYKILVIDGEISVPALPLCSEGLSFPTDKMAYEFKDTFKDLLDVAKPLL